MFRILFSYFLAKIMVRQHDEVNGRNNVGTHQSFTAPHRAASNHYMQRFVEEASRQPVLRLVNSLFRWLFGRLLGEAYIVNLRKLAGVKRGYAPAMQQHKFSHKSPLLAQRLYRRS